MDDGRRTIDDSACVYNQISIVNRLPSIVKVDMTLQFSNQLRVNRCYNAAMTLSRQVLYPTTLAEALHLLAEQGGSAHAVPGAGSGALFVTAGGAYISTARLHEMAGIQQLGGRIAIGFNTTHANLARASLIRSNALCLTEAAERHADAGATLGQALRDPQSAPDILLALTVLDAEIEMAAPGLDSAPDRRWLRLADVLARPLPELCLLVAVRFRAPWRRSGSALVHERVAPGMKPSLHAAAAHLSLDQDAISAVSLALAPADGYPVRLEHTADVLLGQPVTPELFDFATRSAQKEILSLYPSPESDCDFYIDLSGHLVRKALNLAVARVRAAV